MISNNTNMIMLLLAIVVIILSGVSYFEFKKIKLELNEHNEILKHNDKKLNFLLSSNQPPMQDMFSVCRHVYIVL